MTTAHSKDTETEAVPSLNIEDGFVPYQFDLNDILGGGGSHQNTEMCIDAPPATNHNQKNRTRAALLSPNFHLRQKQQLINQRKQFYRRQLRIRMWRRTKLLLGAAVLAAIGIGLYWYYDHQTVTQTLQSAVTFGDQVLALWKAVSLLY